jgi:hypothetical protein
MKILQNFDLGAHRDYSVAQSETSGIRASFVVGLLVVVGGILWALSDPGGDTFVSNLLTTASSQGSSR